MNPIKKFVKWLRDPFGDKRTLEQQENYHHEVLSEIVNLRLSRHPYRSLRKECREPEREVSNHV